MLRKICEYRNSPKRAKIRISMKHSFEYVPGKSGCDCSVDGENCGCLDDYNKCNCFEDDYQNCGCTSEKEAFDNEKCDCATDNTQECGCEDENCDCASDNDTFDAENCGCKSDDCGCEGDVGDCQGYDCSCGCASKITCRHYKEFLVCDLVAGIIGAKLLWKIVKKMM